MIKRDIFLLILTGILILFHSAICGASVVYVSTDGSGDYNCDGKNDDVEINQALRYVVENKDATTVYLKSGTYVISDTLYIGSNTILEGDSDTRVKLVDKANWVKDKSLVACMGNPPEKQTSVKTYNITIRNFEIDGNYGNNDEHDKGNYYYSLINLCNVHGASINDMYLHNNGNDLIKVSDSSDVSVFNNVGRKQGHEFFYADGGEYYYIYNNSIQVSINTAIRFYNSRHAQIFGNEIFGSTGGYVGIYIVKYGAGVVNDIEIYDNTIHDLLYSGIYLQGFGPYSDRNTARDVSIHNNLIYDCATASKSKAQAGITICHFNNTTIENNEITGINGNGIEIDTHDELVTPSATGFILFVRDNTIKGTTKDPSMEGSGYAIRNYLPSSHSVIAEGNFFNQNYGACSGGAITCLNNIESDPMLVDDTSYLQRMMHIFNKWTGKGWIIDAITNPFGDVFGTSGKGRTDIISGHLSIISGTATVDGDLNEWQNVEGLTLSDTSRKTDDDNSATIKAIYDDTCLYLSYTVNDTDLQAKRLNDGESLHMDDSIEFYIDTLNNGGTAMQTDDYHIILNLNGAVVDDTGTGTGKDYSYAIDLAKEVRLLGSINDSNDIDQGYIMEVAVPWADIGGKPENDVVGVLFAINDLDSDDDLYLLNSCGLSGSYGVPDNWGDASII